VAKFDGGLLSSDGGVLALREVEQRLRVDDEHAPLSLRARRFELAKANVDGPIHTGAPNFMMQRNRSLSLASLLALSASTLARCSALRVIVSASPSKRSSTARVVLFRAP
jgi:hypothetical protein